MHGDEAALVCERSLGDVIGVFGGGGTRIRLRCWRHWRSCVRIGVHAHELPACSTFLLYRRRGCCVRRSATSMYGDGVCAQLSLRLRRRFQLGMHSRRRVGGASKAVQQRWRQ